MDAAESPKMEQHQRQIKPGSDLDFLDLRIRQLQNRRLMLLKIQQFKRRAEGNDGKPADQMVDKQCELEAIQRDLEVLMAKKETLEKQRKSSIAKENRETFYGGVYTLPPLLPTSRPPEEETSVAQSIPVVCSSQEPTVVKCPNCEEEGLTETHSKVGETAWMMCSVLTMLGCVAGCCLIPLCADRLKDVSHECSHCHAHIHTHKPV